MTPPPTAAQLGELAGSYWSDEAEVALTAAVDQGKLVLKRRPDTTIALTAIEKDTFRGSIGTITFRRDAAGKVNAFSIKQDRVWDLRFRAHSLRAVRVPERASGAKGLVLDSRASYDRAWAVDAHTIILIATAGLASLAAAQALPFPAPASTPEAVDDTQDFPYLPPLPGARLIAHQAHQRAARTRSRPREDDEAVLAGQSYVKKTYERPGSITPVVFITAYRDALFAAGWRLIDVTKLEEIAVQPETVNVAAHYAREDRNIYARLSQEPGGPYQINVADVGAEDWGAMLETQCRVTLYSVHFDLDRPTIRPESTPTLEKAAALLKAKRSWQIEVQGHMDNIGAEGDALRQVLSAARAKAVAAWLTAHGVPASRSTAKGYGKTRPVAANDSDLGRAKNRRIEIVRKDCSRASVLLYGPKSVILP